MDEYIRREDVIEWFMPYAHVGESIDADVVISDIKGMKAADVAPVTRCKDCNYSTLPSELTRRYGKPGTLTCHNMHAPSNRRNVGSNDFCSYGEPKEKPNADNHD